MKNMGAAPCTAMSLTQWFTRSAPMVWCSFISNATFSLVPTPSTLETSTGSTYFVLSIANKPPKPPISLSTPRVKVLWARYLIRFLVRFARSISTPASAYVIGALFKESWATGVVPSLKRPREHCVFAARQKRSNAAHCSMFGSDAAEPRLRDATSQSTRGELRHTYAPALPNNALARINYRTTRQRLAQGPRRSPPLVSHVGRKIIDQDSKQRQSRNAVCRKNPDTTAFPWRSRRSRTRCNGRGITKDSLFHVKPPRTENGGAGGVTFTPH